VLADAPPTVLIPWSDLTVPEGVRWAVYDGAGEPPDVRAVELYVVPYGGPARTVELIAHLPALRAVQVLTAGVDAVLPHVPAGVALHSGRGLHDASTAEHAVGLILAAQRDLPRWVHDQAAGRWEPHYTRSLAGSRVVVVGFGSIGQALAARLRPFEVEVVPVARRARPGDGVLGLDALDGELPRADAVVLLTPLTEATRGLLDRRRLALLPDGALVVNVARGPVLDTGALLAERGRVRAALDVTDPEPLPPGDSLWNFDNVVITPHVASAAEGSNQRRIGVITENIRRFARGEPLINVVNKTKGY
jgi:phosphoglycerate dehydrogenase-like enzyme